jgi:Fe-S cluster biogenesis protein NfuA
MSESVEKRVKSALNLIRPQLQADGGDVEFVAFENGVVKVQLQGHCAGCPMSMMTLKQGIENFLKKEIPEVQRVENVQ